MNILAKCFFGLVLMVVIQACSESADESLSVSTDEGAITEQADYSEAAQQEESEAMPADDSSFYPGLTYLSVGVADLDVALELWVGHLGMNIVSSKEGSDPELERIWGLEEGDIARQALIRTNDNESGMIHFIEFNQPDQPVRQGAQTFDLTPKNMDLYVQDLPGKIDALKAAGYKFRTEQLSEFVSEDGTIFREIHMLAHDDINVVLIELVGQEYDFSEVGTLGITLFVFIVPDIQKEADFFETTLQVDLLSENKFSGPQIEEVVGLPQGTVLHIQIWGKQGHDMGKLEMIEYQGTEGNNLYPKATPKSLGVLHIGYRSADIEPLISRLNAQNVSFTDYGITNTLAGEGRMISFVSPAGMRVEVYEDK